jgi:hypothetical protein
MVLQAINLGILTLLFFIVGMIKPKWALFFMEKPTRFLIVMVTTVLFMIVMTMYGSGIKEAKKVKKPKATVSAPATVPVPIPDTVPVPVPTDTPPKDTAKKK